MTKPHSQPQTRGERIADARRRFGQLMKFMFVASLVVLAMAFGWFRYTDTPMPLPFMGAIAVAVIGSLMLTAALMGLVFFSSASGTDDDTE